MGKLCYYLRHGLLSIVTGLLHEDEPVDPVEKAAVEKLVWRAVRDTHNER
jgi:hypothetical protein